MKAESVFVIQDGTVTGLAGGPLSLASLGARTTRRASHLEFNPVTNNWTVTDAVTRELLHADPDYDKALAWERDYYNRQLDARGVDAGSIGFAKSEVSR